MSRTAIPIEETVAPARRPHVGAPSSSALRHETDERLVALTRAGSERAFAEIMRRYQRPLHVFCLQFLRAGRAEDAVQQAFLQAFLALRDGARREIALRPWLYRIARNCSIDLLRKQGSDHDELDPEYDGMPQPPGLLEQKEELARVVAAIQALPEGQRRALTLRELEGRSYGEISAELGHTDSGVRQLIFRARTTLRNLGALIFPVGSMRWRMVGQAAPVPADPHQVAVAASVSAPGGAGALDALGAIVATTVTLAAGGGAAYGHHHADRPAVPLVTARQSATVPPPAYLLQSAGSDGAGHHARSGVRVRVRLTAALGGTAGTIVAGPTGTPPAAAPPVPSMPPATAVLEPVPFGAQAPPAAGSGAPADGPRAQVLNAMGGAASSDAGSGAAPAAGGNAIALQGAAAAAPGGQAKPAPSASPQTQPAKGVSAPGKTAKPAAPKLPAAPKAPALPKTAKPQTAKQPAKAQLAKTQPAKAQLAKTQLAKTQLVKTQLVKTQLVKTQLVKTQAAVPALSGSSLPLASIK